jgi:hypothetical protein
VFKLHTIRFSLTRCGVSDSAGTEVAISGARFFIAPVATDGLVDAGCSLPRNSPARSRPAKTVSHEAMTYGARTRPASMTHLSAVLCATTSLASRRNRTQSSERFKQLNSGLRVGRFHAPVVAAWIDAVPDSQTR